MQTLVHLFEDSVRKYGDNNLLWEKKSDKYEATNFRETKNFVYKFAAGLIELGVEKGDKLALLSEGRNDWVYSELGILYTGAINVPLSVKLDSKEIKFRLNHSEARMLIVSSNQAKKLLEIKDELPFIEKIILLDEKESLNEKEIFFSEICRKGELYLQNHKEKFTSRWQSVSENDYANICYSSGTTADSKGIILSHLNYFTNIEQAKSLVEIPESFITLLILPWDHAFAHTAGVYTFIAFGAAIASIQVGKTPMETLRNIPKNIREIKPSMILSVPSLAKNFKKNIEAGIRKKGKFAEKLFNHALKVAMSINKEGINKIKPNLWQKSLLKFYEKILFSKIRENFGGKLEYFIGGGAYLDIDLQRFFYAIGIPMFQGYGLTEASPIISSNSMKRHKLGTSGYLVKSLELKICDENKNEISSGEKGEIVVKGNNTMIGYYKNEKATKEVLRDNWLYTGDLGYMDNDGFVYVLGRFKSLLISDDGEKYSPEGMEEAFVSQSKFINQCLVYNNQNPYTTILVCPNKEAIRAWAIQETVDLSSENGKTTVLNFIDKELKKYRIGGIYEEMFPQRWLPSAVAILNEGFTEENNLMNSTMKIIRPKIVEKYAERINFLYTPEAKNICNKYNMEVEF